jgi:hypothetical protein
VLELFSLRRSSALIFRQLSSVEAEKRSLREINFSSHTQKIRQKKVDYFRI